MREPTSRGDEPSLVDAVVDAHRDVAHVHELGKKRRAQAHREEAVRDRASERSRLRPRRVDVDPLMIVRRVGEFRSTRSWAISIQSVGPSVLPTASISAVGPSKVVTAMGTSYLRLLRCGACSCEGAVALVTGGASGLGEATMRRLHVARRVHRDRRQERGSGHRVAKELGIESTVLRDRRDIGRVHAGRGRRGRELGELRIAVELRGQRHGRPHDRSQRHTATISPCSSG